MTTENFNDNHYLGIDFGTSNSYFCLTTSGFLGTTPVMFDGKTSISTSVLWKIGSDGNDELVAFGDRAVEEWGLCSVAERKHRRISTMFKPDIGFSESARLDALAFLKAAMGYMDEQGMISLEQKNNLNVVLGVPAVQATGFQTAISSICKELTLGDVRTIPEPVGALINHVASRNDVSPGDARKGILVIDFGGGTCDIAFMLRLEVKSAWGDAMLGGRLFDDLFFQWYLEQNPQMAPKINSSRDEYYIHWILCREMKERFSVTMERDRTNSFSHHIHIADMYYGGLTDATWSEFEHRARHYKPGKLMSNMLKQTSSDPRTAVDGTYDLIEWFSSLLLRGLSDSDLKLEDVRYVILTGGSSAWLFVKDIVKTRLHLGPDCLFFSANPMTAVGEGIALLPVIQGLHRTARSRIKSGHKKKIDKIIHRIEGLADDFSKEIADEIVSLIVNEEMREVLSDFSRNGGAISRLKERISETVGARSQECDDLIKSREQDILTAVNHEIIEILSQWFNENGMRNWSNDRYYLNDLGVSRPDTTSLQFDDPLLDLVKTITHLIMMYGAGGLLGGGGLALLIPGLPGLVLGAVIGVIFSMVGFEMLKKPLEKSFNRIKIPSWISSSLYNDRKLDKMVSKLQHQLRQDILTNARQIFSSKVNELRPAIAELVEAVIEDLTALDHL